MPNEEQWSPNGVDGCMSWDAIGGRTDWCTWNLEKVQLARIATAANYNYNGYSYIVIY